jgi:hypothetical protein
MNRLPFQLLPALLLLGAAGCAMTDWLHPQPPPAQKPAVEQVKLPPKQIKPEDVDPKAPRAAVEALQREMDWDQNEAEKRKDDEP